MLDNLEEFAAAFVPNYRVFATFPFGTFTAGDLFCPTCGDPRRMNIKPIWAKPFEYPNGPSTPQQFIAYLPNTLHSLSCVQCSTAFTALVYVGPDGTSLMILPKVYGGAKTAHTPDGIAFYLDQAQRSHSAGACSASVAMYRGALEQLLFQQGYTKGMLGAKINQLLEDVKTGKAPKWALEINIEYLELLKELGNGSIHPNDGDIGKQVALDRDLLNNIGIVFHQILYVIYDVPKRSENTLADFRKRAGIVKK
jgi:hypothetical protein